MILKPFQPTCENLLLEFVQKIQAELPDGLELSGMKLYETASSYAEWENLKLKPQATNEYR